MSNPETGFAEVDVIVEDILKLSLVTLVGMMLGVFGGDFLRF